MSTNHVTDKLPEYLMSELEGMEKATVEAHLQDCGTCREEFNSLSHLWAKLAALPNEKPTPQLRANFSSMLEAYEEGIRQGRSGSLGITGALNSFLQRFWPKEPVLQLGLALILLVVGAVGGARVSGSGEQQSELAHLRSEVQDIGRLLTLSLLTQQSASERLRGVASTYQMQQADQQVVSALVRALKYDPNVNVRLAAVDALGKFTDDPAVQREIVQSLPGQTSPMVQLALVDLVVQERMSQSKEVLQKMSGDPHLNATVKKRIDAGMKELSL